MKAQGGMRLAQNFSDEEIKDWMKKKRAVLKLAERQTGNIVELNVNKKNNFQVRTRRGK